MSIPVPTLSTAKFVTNLPERVDRLLTYFVYSDKLQTSIYGDNITSLQWILEQYPNSMIDVSNAVSRSLNTYLRRYFPDAADVQVETEDEDPDVSSSKVRMRLDVTVQEDGKTYSVAKLLSIVDGRFKEFISLNNNEVSS